MDSLNIPLVPQWNLISCCTSTPDDGYLYVGSKCINYISKIEKNQSPIMKVFCTRQRVKCLACDPDWSTKKHFAALVGDNSVQIWNLDADVAEIGHKAHIKQVVGDGDGPPIQMVTLCYLASGKVLSIDLSCLVLYCVTSNTYVKRKRIIPEKHEISIIKGSPYNENIFAAGSTRGLILLVDLTTEIILYTMRGHDTEITSLSWMAIQCTTANLSCNDKSEKTSRKNAAIAAAATSEEIFDIYDYDYLENEFGAPTIGKVDKEDEVKHVGLEKPKDEFEGNENFNFQEACQNLKDDINALKNDDLNDSNDMTGNGSGNKLNVSSKQVTLKDCQESGPCPNSNSSISCESNGSIEMIDHSSDESCSGKEHQMIHKAVVHRQADIEENRVVPQFQDIFLASGSHDSVVYIWDTKSGGVVDKLHLKSSSQNAFIEICWLNDCTILTNTRSGELMKWNRARNTEKKYAFELDNTKVFSHRGVVSLCKLTNSETIWTISFYREITCEDMKTNEILAKYSCASTNIAAIEERPDDMNKIAFACADRRIGILNVSNISMKTISIDNCSNKIDSAVLCLAWSGKDSMLAFGTIEGKIGIIDTDKTSNVPIIFNSFCGKPIYSMQWYEQLLFVCGNKKIAIYDSLKKKKDAHILQNINDASALSIRDNFLLIGTNSGKLELYKNINKSPMQYELVSQNSAGHKYISDINWSPIRLTHCAVSSLSNAIYIFCLSKDSILSKVRHYVMGDNTSGNACVKWSNRNENLLLSCGFDGAIRIWDISQTSNAHIYVKQYNCPMLCGLFSPVEENIVICAGKATSIEMFDMRSQIVTELKKTKCKRNKDKIFNDVKWATKIVPLETATASRKRNKKHNVNILKSNVSTTEESESLLLPMMENLELQSNTNKDKENKPEQASMYIKKRVSTILYLTTREANIDALSKILVILESNSDENNVESSKIFSKNLFGSRSEIKQLLDEELENCNGSGTTKTIAHILIPQIKGELEEEILKCIQTKKLTEWHLSLAPTISYRFWKMCCIAYATQLIEMKLTLQAATYLLACHEIKDVIQILMGSYNFREAWIIGKLYREPDDPLIEKILENWICYLEKIGSYECAAFICAINDRFEKCYSLLCKRQNANDEHSKILDILRNKLENKQKN